MPKFKDDTDKAIVEYLKEDSRGSYVSIGKRLGLSESAVRNRVKNMIHSKVIKRFTLEVGEDPASAIVLASVDSTTTIVDSTAVSTEIAKLDGVKTVYEITGQYDISAIVSASDISKINLIIDELRKISGVVDTNTVIILRKVI